MQGRKRTGGVKPVGGSSLTGMMRLMIVVLVVFFGSTFMLSTMIITAKAERDYEIRESETVINNMSGGIQANLNNYKDISRLIMLNDDVVNYLHAEKDDAGMINDAKSGILSVLNVCTNIDSVYVFRNDGTFLNTGRGEYIIDFEKMRQEEWQREIFDRRGGAVVSMNGNGAIFRKDGIQIITIARAIYDIYTQQQTGMLLMNISEKMLTGMTDILENDNVCIMSAHGFFLAGNSSLAGQYNEDYARGGMVHNEIRMDSDRRTVSGCAIDDTPLVVMCATRANTDVVPRETIYVLLLLLVAFLISLIITGTVITRNVTRPILELSAAMENTKSSGWLEKLNVDMPDNEIGVLADSYNSMIEHLNELFNRLIENEKTVQRAEMRVLHEQIKPHFLYNSLETISFMALDAGAENVYSALETLGSFYRNFLSKGNREIPLQREICIIQDYLSLQKLRYGDIISDEYAIDDDTLSCMIPKLILQPLVENCIYHGIRPKGEEGVIRITSRLQRDGLHITVHDTGIGMSREQIENVLSVTMDEDADENGVSPLSGFGLKGTIQRIRYYCDSDDVVQIRSVPGEYTEIEITIPQMKGADR